MDLFKSSQATFRLKNFNVDGSLTTQVVIDNLTDSQLLELRRLHESKQVGVILCDPAMLTDLENLLNQIK